jgi:activator of HSP90 ATPase
VDTADPTRNVLQLVEAVISRQDDLRAAEKDHMREVLALRSELGEQERECAKETAALRAEHNQQLREAEAQRINAIRSVDVEAVQRAAEVQATQASTLAAQVATSAETLRTQVAAAANAATIALAAALEPIIKDIADLRRAQYEAQGQKTQVVETQARGGSIGLWIGLAAMGFFSVLTLVAAVVTLLVR